MVKDNVSVYDNFFSKEDYNTILKKVEEPNWSWGHTSYSPDHPHYNQCTPFWHMDLRDDEFFTGHLLNKIQELVPQYDLLNVYANGHTYGLDGTFHQDAYDDKGRTFLLYANKKWLKQWGGMTSFYKDNNEVHSLYPSPNKGILFPGMIFHRASSLSRLFIGLRVTIAWKLQRK